MVSKALLRRIKEEVTRAVQAIKDNAWDDETACTLERHLYEAFVCLATQHPGDLGDIARIVWSTREIEFVRR